jgi:hypothetical protein
MEGIVTLKRTGRLKINPCKLVLTCCLYGEMGKAYKDASSVFTWYSLAGDSRKDKSW